jgi:hypothetical protein
MKAVQPRSDRDVEEAEAKVNDVRRDSRDLAATAKEIADPVYDLKAVNPDKRPVVDTRTPGELIKHN